MGRVVYWEDMYETHDELIRDLVAVNVTEYRMRGFAGVERLQELQLKLIVGKDLTESEINDVRVLAGEVSRYHGR